jgi:bacillopeptidase F
MSMSPRSVHGAALLFLAGPLTAGEISPQFAAKLAALPAGALSPALVVLHEQLDVQRLDRNLESGNATRWMRHFRVVTDAQAVANRTQPAVLALINAQPAGAVADVQPFWILNGIGLRATPAALLAIAAHPAVRVVDDGDAPIELIRPVGPVIPSPGILAAVPEPGLLDIKADFLWNLGILGQGRIVSSLDTGVEGTHPAYRTRWRGFGGAVPVAQCWHSPTLRAPQPADSNGHGTHTMGTMCGDDGGANRVGMAPQAQWIASDSIAGSNLGQIALDAIAGFQWSADPDRNPLTVHDVPDASSNSWGFSPFFHGVAACDAQFWAAIDVCDAAGCAVVFAAGNEGARGAVSLRTPSDRATSETNCFSVGALLAGSTAIAGFSSRGPSGCPGAAIKPEVSARGDNVRSSTRGATYGLLSGTSMACPHVAGAVALLRQVDPNLSSSKVKEYLFAGCDDLGTTGNDNTFGAGRINLQTSYNRILADRDRVTVGVVSTTQTVRQGQTLLFQLNVINHTAIDVPTELSVDLFVVDLAAIAPIILPFQAMIPANLNLDPNWVAGGLVIPAGLPAAFFTYKYQVVFTARDPITQRVMSIATTDVRIAP